MTKDHYKYLSIVLGVIVIGLLIYIFTRPKQIDTTVAQQDLATFSNELSQWSAENPTSTTPQSQQQLSGYLSALSSELQSYK